MARLKSKHKRFVVKRLAMFDRPSEVRDALQNRFGVEANLSQLAHYDPTTSRGQDLSADLKELFHETREEFKEEQKGIAIAQKAKRLQELQKMYYRLKDSLEELPDRNVLGKADIEAEMREVLEQIAKETGGMYTRKRLVELMGEDGGPIETEEKSGGVQFYVPEEQDIDELTAGGDGASEGDGRGSPPGRPS